MDAIQASDIRRRDKLINEWLKEHKTNSYRPEDLPSHIVPPTNNERSECEVFEFLRDKPDQYFLYVTFKDGTAQIGTWMGDSLGSNVHLGSVYVSNMGDKRRSIWFTAITGERYCGTFFCGAGDYARVRKVKS